MVLVNIYGGLGNQMFQYAAGYVMAKRIGTRLLLDTAFYLPPSPHTFGLDQLCISQGKSCNNTLYLKYLKKILKICSKRAPFLKQHYLKGYFQDEKVFIDFKDEIRREFEFKDKLKPPGGNVVAVHIRRGDYVELAHIHLVCTPKYYENAIDYIKSRVESPMFYIFSDDIQWCKANIKIPKGSVYVDSDVGPTGHDMQLMSLCSHNIISNSSYSWWAAWLNRNDGKIIVAPDKWYADREETDIYTANMVKIPVE